MVLRYTMCDVELPYPGLFTFSGLFPYLSLFPFPGFLQGFLQDFILGLPYSGKFPYPGIFSFPGLFPYTVKASILKLLSLVIASPAEQERDGQFPAQ